MQHCVAVKWVISAKRRVGGLLRVSYVDSSNIVGDSTLFYLKRRNIDFLNAWSENTGRVRVISFTKSTPDSGDKLHIHCD